MVSRECDLRVCRRRAPPCWNRYAPGLATQAMAPMCSDPFAHMRAGIQDCRARIKADRGRLCPAPTGAPPSCLPASYPGSSSMTRGRAVDLVGPWGGIPSPHPPTGLPPEGGEGEKHRLAVSGGNICSPTSPRVIRPRGEWGKSTGSRAQRGMAQRRYVGVPRVGDGVRGWV